MHACTVLMASGNAIHGWCPHAGQAHRGLCVAGGCLETCTWDGAPKRLALERLGLSEQLGKIPVRWGSRDEHSVTCRLRRLLTRKPSCHTSWLHLLDPQEKDATQPYPATLPTQCLLQVEAPRGSKEDDTSVNGVLAVCNDGHDRPLVAHGQWGTWRPYQFCPPGWGEPPAGSTEVDHCVQCCSGMVIGTAGRGHARAQLEVDVG